MKTYEQKKEYLLEKYGDGLFIDFSKLRNNPFFRLSDIGKKYGFTREYARQVYFFIYQEPYTPIKNKLTKKLKSEIKLFSCENDPRFKYAEYKKGNNNLWKATLVEKLFFEECKNRGLNVRVPCKRETDIIINNYIVDVKSSYKPFYASKTQKTPYYRYRVSLKQLKKCDFIVCYHLARNSFFIIPNNACQRYIYILLHEIKMEHKYFKYENAWDYFFNKKENICPHCGKSLE